MKFLLAWLLGMVAGLALAHFLVTRPRRPPLGELIRERLVSDLEECRRDGTQTTGRGDVHVSWSQVPWVLIQLSRLHLPLVSVYVNRVRWAGLNLAIRLDANDVDVLDALHAETESMTTMH